MFHMSHPISHMLSHTFHVCFTWFHVVSRQFRVVNPCRDPTVPAARRGVDLVRCIKNGLVSIQFFAFPAPPPEVAVASSGHIGPVGRIVRQVGPCRRDEAGYVGHVGSCRLLGQQLGEGREWRPSQPCWWWRPSARACRVDLLLDVVHGKRQLTPALSLLKTAVAVSVFSRAAEALPSSPPNKRIANTALAVEIVCPGPAACLQAD